MGRRLKRLFRAGGPIRSLAGWGYAVKLVVGAAGFGLSAGAIQTWWADMPFWFVKFPLALGGGGLAFIAAAWLFSRWRNTPALPGPFHEDVRQLGRHIGTFTETLYQLYYTFAHEEGYQQHVWWKALDAGQGARLEEFAERIYSPDGDTSASGFYNRSNIAGGSVGEQEFEEFHRARAEITSFLSRWYPRLKRDSRAREQALERLARYTNARTFTALEVLEDALSEALSNEVRGNAGWRRMIDMVRREVGYEGR